MLQIIKNMMFSQKYFSRGSNTFANFYTISDCKGSWIDIVVWINSLDPCLSKFQILQKYCIGGYYHHVSENNAAAHPNMVNICDIHGLFLETCIIWILTKWYGYHCILIVAGGQILKWRIWGFYCHGECITVIVQYIWLLEGFHTHHRT